jgi:hypothetical protein
LINLIQILDEIYKILLTQLSLIYKIRGNIILLLPIIFL